jgi:peroxiredoxin
MTGSRLAVGDLAPCFTLPDARGGAVALDPRGNAATAVIFTANGCPFARSWHGRVQAVARDFADQGVAVLQIVSNDETDHPEDSLEAMRERVAAGGLAGPFLRDADQEAARAYDATATPEVFVLDRQGGVRYHGAPDGDHDDPAQDARWMRDALADVLAGRPVRRPETSPAGCSIKWRVELLWWDGCPSHGGALDLLRATLAELGRGEVTVATRQVASPEEARRLRFPGSPTIRVDGRDLFPAGEREDWRLGCRVYATPEGLRGSPTAEMLRAALV